MNLKIFNILKNLFDYLSVQIIKEFFLLNLLIVRYYIEML